MTDENEVVRLPQEALQPATADPAVGAPPQVAATGWGTKHDEGLSVGPMH